MNTHQFMHSGRKGQDSHSHDHQHGQQGGIMAGVRQMGILGLLPLIAHDQDWLSNYRPSKLVPASNKVILVTILALLAGVVLWHILPAGPNNVGLGLAIAAAAHLMLLVIGGLSVTLLIRRLRSKVRQTVINSIPWRGTEQVLDVGCGTGMLLNGCARQLTSGRATGIDLWQEAIAGSRGVLMANARAEGVADKIEYREMDARHLSFDDASFNVVVSSAALHHVGNQREDRERAVSEMIRVLTPGGYLSLADVGPMIAIAESVISRAGLRITHREQGRFIHFIAAQKA